MNAAAIFLNTEFIYLFRGVFDRGVAVFVVATPGLGELVDLALPPLPPLLLAAALPLLPPPAPPIPRALENSPLSAPFPPAPPPLLTRKEAVRLDKSAVGLVLRLLLLEGGTTSVGDAAVGAEVGAGVGVAVGAAFFLGV